MSYFRIFPCSLPRHAILLLRPAAHTVCIIPLNLSSGQPLSPPQGVMIPYAPPGRGFSDLRCLWGGYLLLGCQAVRWYFSGG